MISCREEVAVKRVSTSFNASVPMLGLSSASSLSFMAFVLCGDVVSILKIGAAALYVREDATFLEGEGDISRFYSRFFHALGSIGGFEVCCILHGLRSNGFH